MTVAPDAAEPSRRGRRRVMRVAAVGVAAFVVTGSVVAGVVSWSEATSRMAEHVERYARASVGCTTTLDFEVAGTFYVFEERGAGVERTATGCEAMVDPGADFAVELFSDDRPVAVRSDSSMAYDVDGSAATSIGRFEIDRPGRYEITVIGSESDVVAAIGRDPQRGVDALRVLALALIGAGLVVAGVVTAGMAASIGGRSRDTHDRSVTVGGGGSWAPPSGPPLG